MPLGDLKYKFSNILLPLQHAQGQEPFLHRGARVDVFNAVSIQETIEDIMPQPGVCLSDQGGASTSTADGKARYGLESFSSIAVF